MSEKVVLPKEVAEAIERVWSNYTPEGFTKHMVLTNWTLLSERHANQYSELRDYAYSYPIKYMEALVKGYEVEQTPEDKVREYYKQINPDSNCGRGSRCAIRETLTILNIKIEGVNA